jgi:2-dehydropantoate 2-reductase
MRSNGLTLKQAGETVNVRPRVTSDTAALGVQDFVILTLKANAVAGAVDSLMPLLGDRTSVLFAQNGMPWWYFYRHGGAFEGCRLESVDPGGAIWNRIGPERALGCVVWQAAAVEAPGVIAHNYGDRMPLGEPSGDRTDRVMALSGLLTAAGIKSPVRPNLRAEIWLKLWGNLSFNPVSVLTLGTLGDLAADPGTHRVIGTMMEEARAVAEVLGIAFPVPVEERIGMAAKVGAHQTSMLQDVLTGRPPELDALLGSVIELSEITGVATPTLKMVYDLVKFRSRIEQVPG